MGLDTERATVRQAFEERVDRIERFVDDFGGMFDKISTRKDEVVDRIDNFRYHHGRLEQSLVILLFGGTGAGKSTLINALAGREISSTSVRRAHTENYFIFHHRETPIAFLEPVIEEGDHWFPHDREPLREKVIIDAPDFDSLKVYNRDKVLGMLELADMVLTVVTSEKYRDRALHDLLAGVKGTKRFVVAYNKIDREYSDAVVDQLSGELASLGISADIYPVSALNACKNREDGGSREVGKFTDLLRVIEEELDQAQIREIKRANLDGLFGSIRHEVIAAVPEDFAERSAGLDGRLDGLLSTAADTASTRVIEDVFSEERGELASALRSIQYHSFGGIFGFYMALVDKLRAMRPGHVSVGDMDQFGLRRMLSRHCERINVNRLRETMEIAADDVGKELRQLGMAENLGQPLRGQVEGDTFYTEMVEAVTDALSDAFFAQFQKYCLGGVQAKSKAHWLRDMKYGALPTLFVAYVAGNLVYQYFWLNNFASVGTDYLTSSVIVLLIICFGVQHAAEKRFTRENWGFLDGLRGEVTGRVGAFLRQTMGSELAEIDGAVGRIRTELSSIATEDLPTGDGEMSMMDPASRRRPAAEAPDPT